MTSTIKQQSNKELSHLLNKLKNQDSGAQYPIISYNKAKELGLKIYYFDKDTDLFESKSNTS